jgi:hypothetical protein
MTDLFETRERAVQAGAGRRTFLQKLAFAGALLGAAPKRATAQQTSPAVTDADLLNYLLNLEFVEAEFYTYATTGKGISEFFGVGGPGTPNETTGGRAVVFTDDAVRSIAAELADNELAHVKLIRSTLTDMGAQPVAKPAINLNALGAGFGSQAEFLTLARVFEDVGVTAYNGALLLMQSKSVMNVAARVLATEAQHAGNIRVQIAQRGISTKALDGVDITPLPSGSYSFSANSFGLASTRAPGEVLALLYGASNATSGAFFPSGVNGAIHTSTTPAPPEPAIRNQGLATFTANPELIISPTGFGTTTLTWNAPGVNEIEIRVGTINGGLLARVGSSGQVTTGPWVTDGMTFYLQDVTGGKGLFPANTLATVMIRLQRP